MSEDKPKKPSTPAAVKAPISEVLESVRDKIEDADNILVTLSKNPTIDEISSAIALTLALNELGKHATAIFSGKAPEVLEFLEPEKTFESNTDSLQDFIIALNKEKADHLRYKIEGDYVKVYITPYKTTISEEDLEFSRGEINVDLIIAINVTSVDDLDAALQKHGRILHDATIINISNAIPGHIGGTEWNEGKASSIAEMLTQLFDTLSVEKTNNISTALLTGIISATDRFSNEKTTPEVMALSAKLMENGADQQLINAHMKPKEEPKETAPEYKEVAPDSIDADGEAEEESNIATKNAPEPEKQEEDKTEFEISHDLPTDQAPQSTLTPEQELEKLISGSANAAPQPKDLMQELVDSAKRSQQKKISLQNQQQNCL